MSGDNHGGGRRNRGTTADDDFGPPKFEPLDLTDIRLPGTDPLRSDSDDSGGSDEIEQQEYEEEEEDEESRFTRGRSRSRSMHSNDDDIPAYPEGMTQSTEGGAVPPHPPRNTSENPVTPVTERTGPLAHREVVALQKVQRVLFFFIIGLFRVKPMLSGCVNPRVWRKRHSP